MVRNIIKSCASAIAAVMLVLCAVYEWTVAGYILMTIGLLWFICESTQFVLKGAWVYTLIACCLLAVLGFGLTFPILLAGFGVEVGACFFVLAAEALVLANAYVWSKK